jgi:hypothetical protein
VTYFLAIQIITRKLQNSYILEFGLLALFVSAFCPALHHDQYVDLSENMLFVPQFILIVLPNAIEIKHINAAIEIMSDPDANLFHLFGERHLRIMWTSGSCMICKLCSTLSPRLLIMKLLLRFADMAEVIKPIHPQELWMCGVVQGFYRTAELRACSAFIFTASVVDFESLDEQASIMPFLKNICLPMLKLVVQIAPPLKILLLTVNDSILKWARHTNRLAPQL